MSFQYDSLFRLLGAIGTLLLPLTLAIFGCSTVDEFETEDGSIKINGIDIYYRAMGQGAPTFVLHGGPGDALETMLPFEALADGCRLVFSDQRAAGRSTGDRDTASHDIDHFVEDLEQLRLKMAGGKINIIGGSWGCMVAMHYAFKYPENVTALVLASTMGVSSDYLPVYRANIAVKRTPEDSAAIELIAASEAYQNRDPAAIEKFWRYYFRAYCFDPSFADSINLWIRDTTYEVVEGRYNKIGEFFAGYDIRDSLSLITCPTLILYGDYDPTPFEFVKPIADGIEGAQLVTIEKAGHWLWVETPERIMPIVREFLNKR